MLWENPMKDYTITPIGPGSIEPNTTRLEVSKRLPNGELDIIHFDAWDDCVDTATALFEFRLDRDELPSEILASFRQFTEEFGHGEVL